MRERHITYFCCSLTAALVCLALVRPLPPMEDVVVSALAISCLLGIRLLLDLLARAVWLSKALAVLVAGGGVLLIGTHMLPLAAVLILQLAADIAAGRSYVLLGGVACLLFILAAWPPPETIGMTVLAAVPMAFIISILERLGYCHELLADRGEEMDGLRDMLNIQKRMLADSENSARIHERNRLAARIHDKVGHGVSGSIILLEGAMAMMDTADETQPKVRDAVELAAKNLRASVDDIRADLRAERSSSGQAGLADISAALSRFQAEHSIKTSLQTDGDLDEVTPLIWVCLRDNLTEALTNVLKHSDAGRFDVTLSMNKKLFRAVFRDNGNATEIHAGMGLQAIEERCAQCGGRCFFQSDGSGFRISMTFAQGAKHA